MRSSNILCGDHLRSGPYELRLEILVTPQPNTPEHVCLGVLVVEHVLASDTNTAFTSSDIIVSADLSQVEQNEEQLPQAVEEKMISTFEDTILVETEQVPNEMASQNTFVDPEALSENFTYSSDVVPLLESEEVRPFTEFIEEFRQAEAITSHTPIAELDVPAFIPTWEEIAAPMLEEVIVPFTLTESLEGEVDEVSPFIASAPETSLPTSPESVARTERPVSPLLRPPSRLRLPRHGGPRPREEQHPEVVTQAEVQVQPTTADASAPIEQQRPARRYRFDRPGLATGATPSSVPSRPEEPKDVANRLTNSTSAPVRTDNGSGTFAAGQTSEREVVAPPQTTIEQISKQTGTQEQQALESTTGTKHTHTEHDRRRRHTADRQREKEQAAPVASVADVVAQIVLPATESDSVKKEDVSPEDLPPLEYSELQAANSRRRRRRRGNSSIATAAINPANAAKSAKPEVPVTIPTPVTPVQSPSVPASRIPATTNPNQYNIVSGYTVNQMNQSTDINGPSGPFMGPEPSPARGSTIGSSTPRDVRAVRAPEAQRVPIYPVRTGETVPSSTSINQLANVVSQAIQIQTDRMVAELRRANQAPTNISVSLPPFPSNERVGVFVDVANLLYSARTLRMTVDFGKLLDFLRGNRRLVRAHAYCPTSPQPGDEQMFLQAVKGLGYRITTKNYKTFSSGAKKADLDLDLCMDVVRLVDGKAVDCIVLVSGDSDFMPMLDYCSDHGVRVEVAAFDEAMSATLRQSCDLFINLSMLEEIRA